MSSIGSSSFSTPIAPVQPNEARASTSNQNQTEPLDKSLEKEKKKKKEEEEDDDQPKLITGSDGAIYQVQGDRKTLVKPAPSNEDPLA